MSSQQQSFQDRLARISQNSGAKAVPANPFPDKTPKKAPKVKTHSAKESGIPDWRENIQYPLAYIRAFLIGVIAVFASRYVRFHLTGGSLAGDDPDLTMMIDGGVATALGFALKEIFRIKGQEFLVAQSAGVIAMVLLMHNLAHALPKQMALVFSPQWVQEVVYLTEPKSILFRGVSFAMGTPSGSGFAGSQSELPTIVQPDGF